MSERLPRIEAAGLLFLADPHFAATPPGQRTEGYQEQVLEKVGAAMEMAASRDLQVVFLGDLFHWPRENPNSLLVTLIDFFGAYSARHRKPWTLVGNHDKYQARYTQDVSMAVLEAAGVLNIMAEAGEQFELVTPQKRLLLGASPDFSPLPGPRERDKNHDVVLWVTHHNIGFPDFEDKPLRIKEIPGVDWVVNGHIHRPQPTQAKGGTRWVNPGGLVRMQFTRYNLERRPQAAIWTPACEASGDLERWDVPVRPFREVFPDQELPEEPLGQAERESLFVRGLERLAWRRTKEGLGLKQFLHENLRDPRLPDTPAEEKLVWQLYEEAVGGAKNGE